MKDPNVRGDWEPAFALPNVDLESAIEADPCALVPLDDERIVRLRERHPKFDAFAGGFRDQFKRPVHPTFLLRRMDEREWSRSISSLAGLRDAVAISYVCRTAAYLQKHGRHPHDGTLWGDTFDFYPWMLDREFDSMIGRSPGMGGIDEAKRFRGQCDPSVHAQRLGARGADRSLLAELIHRWQSHFASNDPSWDGTKLFRSLNMAYHATLMPTSTASMGYDIGRLVGLWVSAFEILSHPEQGNADRRSVTQLLDQTDWTHLRLCEAVFQLTGRNGRQRPPGTLPELVLHHLYRVRNDFLHGNPVDDASLLMPESGRHVFNYAAPLYRMLLTGFLNLRYRADGVLTDDLSNLPEAAFSEGEFRDEQQLIEDGLLTAVEPPSAH